MALTESSAAQDISVHFSENRKVTWNWATNISRDGVVIHIESEPRQLLRGHGLVGVPAAVAAIATAVWALP